MLYFEDLSIGDGHTITAKFTQEDVNKFAEISGDTNPIHLDEEYAAKTFFNQRIVHGALVVSEFSTLLGVHFPGPGAVVKSMETRFLAPVYPGLEIVISAKIVALNPNKKEVVLACNVTSGVITVVEAEVILTMPKKTK